MFQCENVVARGLFSSFIRNELASTLFAVSFITKYISGEGVVLGCVAGIVRIVLDGDAMQMDIVCVPLVVVIFVMVFVCYTDDAARPVLAISQRCNCFMVGFEFC